MREAIDHVQNDPSVVVLTVATVHITYPFLVCAPVRSCSWEEKVLAFSEEVLAFSGEVLAFSGEVLAFSGRRKC